MATKNFETFRQSYKDEAEYSERHREMRNVAYDAYDEEYVAVPYFSEQIDAFCDGAVWADEHPSRRTIEKVIELMCESNKKTYLEIQNGSMSLKEARDFQIDYIQKNW